ncbi:MAG: c-type cytochrome [Cyclobacteriaceae bacterium]|nr:c-type cytochrome [Cyclobacteriaceae bacterium]
MKLKYGFGLLSTFIMLALVLTIGCTHDYPVPAPPIPPYEKADIGLGGIMYDQYWSTEAAFDQTDPNLSMYNENSDFLRCKSCHGWDGLGTEGSYNNRAPQITRPNVSSLNIYELAQTKTADELFEAMTKTEGRRNLSYNFSTYDPITNATEGDKMPDYTEILTDAQIWNIVKFMKEGMFDVNELYVARYNGVYPTGTSSFQSLGKDGDAANGNSYYAANCASCHGIDGLDISLAGKGIGGFARNKPYELQHKTKYGALGVTPPMVGDYDITIDEMKDLLKALSSSTNFPTDIPDSGPVFFATDVEPIFYTAEKCSYCHNPSGVKPSLNLTQGNSYASISSNGFVDLALPASSIIYSKPQGTHAQNYTAIESGIILRWIQDGAKND